MLAQSALPHKRRHHALSPTTAPEVCRVTCEVAGGVAAALRNAAL
jgi:hypothetical protein